MPLPPLPEPDRFGARFRGICLGTLAAASVFLSLMLLNLLQTLSLGIRPFSARAYRRTNRFLAGSWISFCTIMVEKLHGTRLIISGDELPRNENALIICNHQEMPDITVIFAFAHHRGRSGDVKWFVKDTLKYAPGIGWGMFFNDYIYVKRNWVRDRENINRVFHKIKAYQVPVWLITFAEGSRLRPEKLARSRKYAERRGLPSIQHVMLPNTRGFVATVQSLRDHLDAVYDFTIGYREGVPTLWQWTKGYVREVCLNVERFPMAGMPGEKEALADWLVRRFGEKDRLLEHYYQHGSFPAPTAAGTK